MILAQDGDLKRQELTVRLCCLPIKAFCCTCMISSHTCFLLLVRRGSFWVGVGTPGFGCLWPYILSRKEESLPYLLGEKSQSLKLTYKPPPLILSSLFLTNSHATNPCYKEAQWRGIWLWWFMPGWCLGLLKNLSFLPWVNNNDHSTGSSWTTE